MESVMIKPPVEEIDLNGFGLSHHSIRLFVLRLDKMGLITGGNKGYKMKYNIQAAKKIGSKYIVTFGGYYSNHIAAVARLGAIEGIQTIGLVRGEPLPELNSTLKRAVNDGMKLKFLSRQVYQQCRQLKNDALKHFVRSVLEDEDISNNSLYIIPEGGNNLEGFEGCRDILKDIEIDFNIVCCAAGTGTTLAGLTCSLLPNQHALGIAVVNAAEDINFNIKQFLDAEKCSNNFEVNNEFVFGKYAKSAPELDAFIQNFKLITGIEVEQVYTGKMFFGVLQLIARSYFKENSKILCVHTGGLQYLDSIG